MDESTQGNLHRYLLSHEEFAFLFGLLGAKPVLGVDDSPLAGLSADQVALVLRTAGHGLRARGLVRTNADGEIVVESTFLEVLGTCVYPVRLLAVDHWASTAELPALLFVYRRDNKHVLQLRPNPILLELIAAPTTEMVVDAILRFCGVADGGEAQQMELDMTQEDFLALRSLVEQGDIDAAESLSATRGYAPTRIGPLLNTLKDKPRVSAFTAFHLNGTKTVQRRAFTLLQSQQGAWLLRSGETPGKLTIISTDLSKVRELLSDLM